jgi:MFS transporter, SP family, general alpha glucoside:H+ symporter
METMKSPAGEHIREQQTTLFDEAQEATNQEKDLTLWQALRLYPKAVFWSVVMSTSIIMEAYDTMLLGNLFALPAFQQRYGTPTSSGGYEISSPWQSGLSNGGTCGQLIGLLIAGHVSERLGFPRTVMLGLATVAALIFITFFAPSLAVLEVGQILFGELPASTSGFFCS